MKGLIAALLLLAPLCASAEVVMQMENDAGGKIMLTDCDGAGLCETKNNRYFVAAYTRAGNVVRGCWTATEEGQVVVAWTDGDLSIYNMADFEMTNSARQKYKVGL